MSAMRSAVALAYILLATFLPVATADDAGPALEPVVALDDRGEKQVFEVQGFTDEMLDDLRTNQRSEDEWLQLFSVRVAGTSQDRPPLLGEHRVDEDALLFIPRFALRPGQTYEARLDFTSVSGAPREWQPQAQRFHIKSDSDEEESAELVAIYPTRKVLPENHLKFYLHFSRPMSRGEAYQHIHLLDENNVEVEFVFLELPQELWDPELKRFTLFFDPGRIKRGLKPREEFGPSIIEGKTYTLVVDDSWPDSRGVNLRVGQRKEFRVVAPDDTQPDPMRWQLIAPGAVTQTPLVVEFDEPLDHAMLHRVLSVQDSSGAIIDGKRETSAEETIWRFTPAEPWRSGQYELVIDTRLEDLAGNSIARPFEVDLFDTVQQSVPTESVRLPFEIK